MCLISPSQYFEQKREYALKLRSLIRTTADLFGELGSVGLSQMIKRRENEQGTRIVEHVMEVILEAADFVMSRDKKDFFGEFCTNQTRSTI